MCPVSLLEQMLTGPNQAYAYILVLPAAVVDQAVPILHT